MANKVKYEKRAHYPHLKPQEVEIWERFIEREPEAYDEVEYDLALGLKPPFSTTVVPETGGDALPLYLRKIDVVGHKGGRTDFIELKPNAGPGALGQVLGYVALYQNLVDESADITPIVITNNARADMFMLASSMNVKLILV